MLIIFIFVNFTTTKIVFISLNNTPMTRPPKTAVVILNWNGRHFLERFLPSLLRHTPAETADIIVADNASTDDSVAFLRQRYPQVRLIENDANYGFAEGYNRALRQVEADYYVLLNSDIEVGPHWVEPVIAALEADPAAAAAQPKLRAFDRPTHFEYAGAAGGFIDRLGYPFCRGRLFGNVEADRGQYDTPCEIFWATGAALFVRADLYRKFGGLDDAFFAHMEEIDFCWRLKNFGYKILYCPASTVYHVGGGTLPKSSPRKTFLNFRNNLCLLYKNLTPGRFRRVFCLRLVLDSAAALSFLASGGFPECAAVFKAYRAFFRMRREQRAKYGLLPRHAYVDGMYKGSIVWDYYVRRIRRFDLLSRDRFYKEDVKASTPSR